ncbi:PHD-finger family protein, putative [Ichthyophthirius multifiliis]|uniref:PHD-finger family protein, putative n=1 Tax=Ichthyophthirius multifiliis TaxID=5932 RepID=G0QXI6_ICHMU|nr:PHD-finger family protein, putative [Ichthyophthirius multifiliis]EGR30068.1 PHD-finger family protein, putative [Ichthyophthirius multifiliis]|eukprot:XP_004031304.1 PHD-finger family protein, putative [Ichthyophthirius multifiliis]
MEDVNCQICNDGDYADDDLIVFCAKCNISVHQKCYGIPKIPNEDWICELCLNFGPNGRFLRCPLCPKEAEQ